MNSLSATHANSTLMQTIKSTLACIAMTATIAACYTSKRAVTPIESAELAEAPSSTPVHVLIPKDGEHKGIVLEGSGLIVATRIRDIVARVFPAATLAGIAQPSASSSRQLVVTPTIHHWEERATNFSGIADEIRIAISVTDEPSGMSRSSEFYAHSSWWAWVNHPAQSMLDATFEAAVVALLPKSVVATPDVTGGTTRSASAESLAVRGQRLHTRLVRECGVDSFYEQPSLWGAATLAPLAAIYIPEPVWESLSQVERGELAAYAKSLIPAIKSSPLKYAGISGSAPAANSIQENAQTMTDSSWCIFVGRIGGDGQDILADRIVIRG